MTCFVHVAWDIYGKCKISSQMTVFKEMAAARVVWLQQCLSMMRTSQTCPEWLWLEFIILMWDTLLKTTICRLMSRGHTLHGAVTCWHASCSMLMDAFSWLFLDGREGSRSCSLQRLVLCSLAHSEIKHSVSWHGATCYSDVTLELSHWNLLRKLHLSNCWVAWRLCCVHTWK